MYILFLITMPKCHKKTTEANNHKVGRLLFLSLKETNLYPKEDHKSAGNSSQKIKGSARQRKSRWQALQ